MSDFPPTLRGLPGSVETHLDHWAPLVTALKRQAPDVGRIAVYRKRKRNGSLYEVTVESETLWAGRERIAPPLDAVVRDAAAAGGMPAPDLVILKPIPSTWGFRWADVLEQGWRDVKRQRLRSSKDGFLSCRSNAPK